MSGTQTDHRERAYRLLEGLEGVEGWAIPPGQYHRADPRTTLEHHDLGSLERAVEVRLRGAKPMGGVPHNPLCGRALVETRLLVRVGYVLTGAGDDSDTQGEQSGAATLDAIEDRAAQDAHEISARVGYKPNWTGLTPSVIDCAPAIEGLPDPIVLADRVIQEVWFVLKTRAALPGDYGPAHT